MSFRNSFKKLCSQKKVKVEYERIDTKADDAVEQRCFPLKRRQRKNGWSERDETHGEDVRKTLKEDLRNEYIRRIVASRNW